MYMCLHHLLRYLYGCFLSLFSESIAGRSTPCLFFCFFGLFSNCAASRLDLLLTFFQHVFPTSTSFWLFSLFVCFRFLPPAVILFASLSLPRRSVPCRVVSCRAAVARLQVFGRFCSMLLCKQKVPNVIHIRCGSTMVNIIELF